MTREALNRLNEQQLKYCTTLSVLIAKDRENGAKEQYEKDSGKLRGYLECLEQIGILKNIEMKSLYLWFFSESRA